MLDSGAVSQVLGPSERDTASSSAQSTDLELPSELLELYLIETLSEAEETLYDDWFLDVEGELPSNLSEESDEPHADFRRQASKGALHEGSRLPAEVTSSPQRQQGTVTPPSSAPPHHHWQQQCSSGSIQLPSAPQAVPSPADPQVTLNTQGFKHLCSRIMEEMKHTPAIHAPLQSAVAPTYVATLDREELETKVDEPHARPQTEATTEEAAERTPFSAIRADLQAGPSTDVKPPDQTTVRDDGESILLLGGNHSKAGCPRDMLQDAQLGEMQASQYLNSRPTLPFHKMLDGVRKILSKKDLTARYLVLLQALTSDVAEGPLLCSRRQV
ncbi:hypothetical protein Efla_007203 [Eimeria flavescens]